MRTGYHYHFHPAHGGQLNFLQDFIGLVVRLVLFFLLLTVTLFSVLAVIWVIGWLLS